MTLKTRIAFVLMLFPVLLVAQTRKKHGVPAALGNARYFWVETVEGGDAFTPGLLQDDRQAINDGQDALQDWNRYHVTTRRSEADLVFVVRKGRLAEGKLGGTVSGGSRPLSQPPPGQQPASGPGAFGGVEAGSPEDLLQVCLLNADGTLGPVLWERQIADGLDAPQVSLVAQLKRAVEQDYPVNPPASSPKP